MKTILLSTALLLAFTSSNAIASDVQYNLTVKGLTCEFCVQKSTEAIKAMDGVKSIGSDLENEIIKVCADEKVAFTDEQLTKLFVDNGFNYHGMKKQEQCDL